MNPKERRSLTRAAVLTTVVSVSAVTPVLGLTVGVAVVALAAKVAGKFAAIPGALLAYLVYPTVLGTVQTIPALGFWGDVGTAEAAFVIVYSSWVLYSHVARRLRP